MRILGFLYHFRHFRFRASASASTKNVVISLVAIPSTSAEAPDPADCFRFRFRFPDFNWPKPSHGECSFNLKPWCKPGLRKKIDFSWEKKVYFRIVDLGESVHADSNEPPFQRPIFLKLTLPYPGGDFKDTPRGLPGGNPCWYLISAKHRSSKCVSENVQDLSLS